MKKIIVRKEILVLSVLVSVLSLQIIAKSENLLKIRTDVRNSQIHNRAMSSRLLIRYEKGVSSFRVGEDLLILKDLKEKEREVIAVRICSSSNLLLSLNSATINPVRLVELLKILAGTQPPQIIFLRSEDCMTSPPTNLYATEIWALEKGAEFPSNVESLDYSRIKIRSFGFDPVNCSKIDYKVAAKELVKNMIEDKNSYGIIVAYYLKKPKENLRKRVKAAERILSKNGLSKSRYILTFQSWHDGDSVCANEEPSQPMILFVSATKH